MQSLCPPSAPRFYSPAAAGHRSKAKAQAPPTGYIPQRRPSRAAPARRLTSGATAPGRLLLPCDVRLAGEWGGFAVGGPCPPFSATCPAVRRPWAPGAAQGGELLAGQPLLSCPYRPCVVHCWRPGTVPPFAWPNVWVAMGSGGGSQSWGLVPVGGAPARHLGPGPPGAGS